MDYFLVGFDSSITNKVTSMVDVANAVNMVGYEYRDVNRSTTSTTGQLAHYLHMTSDI